MKFSDLATIRKSTVHPQAFDGYDNYLGFEHFAPGTLRFETTGDPASVSSMKQEFLPGDTIYGKLRPYFRKVGWSKDLRGICSTDLWVFKPKPGVDPRFVFYVAGSQEFTDLATQSSEGTRMPRASWSVVKDFEVLDFTLGEQRAIAATLGALDDKIESNRRAMAKLDELFHAMWRREYDGVPVETEEPLSEHVTTQYGLTASASSDADGDKFLRVTDINKQNWIDWTRVPFAPTDDSSRAKYSLSKGDLLVARMADPGKSAIYDGGPIAVFASYLVRLKPSSYEEALFIYGFLKSSEYLDYATGAMTGSVQKNMNAKVIVAASLRWPDSSTLSRFAEHAGPLRDKIAQIVEESSRLSTLRDALLLELLSGRIRTGDLEVGS